jgi:urease accessory protein
MTFLSRFLLVVAACAAFTAPAFAHPGHELLPGFVSGLEHPFGGLDHLLAMFAVGLLSAQLGGRAMVMVPAAFVLTMIAGSLAGFAGMPLPGAEFAIAISIVAIALPVAFALGIPVPLAMAWVALFAFFHGYAHGTELPTGTGALPYMAGFGVATAIIHTAGIAVGLGLAHIASSRGMMLRLAGGAVTIAGLALFVI